MQNFQATKVDGKEFMWDRQPEYWAASSPVLFPFVEVIKNGMFLKEKTMK